LPLSAEGYRASDMLVPRLNWIGRFATALRELGPYAVIGLLPGGALILVSLWVFRHRPWFAARAPWPGHGCSTCSEPYGHRLPVAGGTAVHAGRQPADDRVAFTPAKRSVVCRPIAPRGFDRYFSL
jgi:hypothetical protein